MKAISLWQPWASLWLTDAKIHETRHWPTSHRGWLLVHAAKPQIDDYDGDRIDEICEGIWGNPWGQHLRAGPGIGTATLVDCLRGETYSGYSSSRSHTAGSRASAKFRTTSCRSSQPDYCYRGRNHK